MGRRALGIAIYPASNLTVRVELAATITDQIVPATATLAPRAQLSAVATYAPSAQATITAAARLVAAPTPVTVVVAPGAIITLGARLDGFQGVNNQPAEAALVGRIQLAPTASAIVVPATATLAPRAKLSATGTTARLATGSLSARVALSATTKTVRPARGALQSRFVLRHCLGIQYPERDRSPRDSGHPVRSRGIQARHLSDHHRCAVAVGYADAGGCAPCASQRGRPHPGHRALRGPGDGRPRRHHPDHRNGRPHHPRPSQPHHHGVR